MTKQQTLLNLINDLALPVTDTRAKKLVDGLNDQELDDLISKYESVKAYHDKLEEEAFEANPEAAGKILEQADDKALERELELINQEEAEVGKQSEELDMVETETESRFATILDKQKLDNIRAQEQLNSLLEDMIKAAKQE